MAAPQPPPYNSAYLPNGATAPTSASISPGAAATLLPNQGRAIQAGPVRVLCIADVRGNLRSLNDLAKQAKADHILHTGDFGFYDDTSLERIAEKTLKHVALYSPLVPEPIKKAIQQSDSGSSVKARYSPNELLLSELPLLLRGDIKLEVPVYTVWGACEDVRVLEKFRSGDYKVKNLHIIDEARSLLLETGGVKLRLLGLGGAVVMHKLFDNGEGRSTIAGGQGTMWTTLLQMGELIDTAARVYDPTETRVFITHASPAREGILNQLSVTLKADFSISAGLHFRYGSSYNEFSVNPTLDHYRGKLAASKASFNDVWETVKGEVEPAIQQNDAQQNLLKNALLVVDKMPTTAAGGNVFGGVAPPGQGHVDESAFKNMWNFNLADAAFGWLVLEVQEGRIGTEMRAQGFNFSHRGQKQHPGSAPHQAQTSSQPPATTSGLVEKTAGPPEIASTVSTPAAAIVPPPATNIAAVSSSLAATPSSNILNLVGNNRRPTSAVPPAPYGSPAGAQPAISGLSGGPVGAKPAIYGPSGPSGPSDTATTGTGAKKDGGFEKASSTGANGPLNNNNSNTDTRLDARSSLALKMPTDSNGLFVMNVATDELVRELFADQDQSKILKIQKMGTFNKVAWFANEDDRDAALARLPANVKERHGEDRSRPLVKVFESREARPYHRNTGHWGSSSRGGSTVGSNGIPAAGQTGAYRAVTTQGSDSDSNRRGNTRGGSYRGGGGNGTPSGNDPRRERRGRGPGGRNNLKDGGNGGSSPGRTHAQAAPVASTSVPQPADA